MISISKLAMINMFAAMAMFGSDVSAQEKGYFREEESPEERQRRLDLARIEQNKAKGLKEFVYGSHIIWALNQKSADKKAKKLLIN